MKLYTKLLFTILIVFPTIVSAQITTYTSRAAWLAATANVKTVDFTAAAPPPHSSYTLYPQPGLTLSGVAFAASKNPGAISIVSQTYCCATYARGFDSAASDSGFQITLPSGTTAFGFDAFTVVSGNMTGTNQDRIDVTVGGRLYTFTTAQAPANVFFGVVSATAIPSLTIAFEPGPAQVNLINFAFNTRATGTDPAVAAVLNAGDFGTHLAPGLLTAVFGTNFGSGPASSVTATVGGKAAFVAAVAPTQLTLQLPVDAPTGATSLIVTVSGVASAPYAITLDTVAPALLSANGSGSGVGLIRTLANANVTAAAPAKPGDNLVAYAVGLGPTNPPAVTGMGPAGQAPTTSPVTLTVGGQAATVAYGGGAPGLPATYQVNFTVPAGLQGNQPVVVSVGGKSSAPVTVPLVGISSVVNNASFGSVGVIAPGSIVSVFANGIGSTNQTVGFPASAFQGVSVLFNGTPAPLFHLNATQNQIDLLVPFELPTSGTVNVQLRTATGTLANFPVTMAAAAPGLYFLADPATMGRLNVLAQFNNTVWLAMPDATAAALKIPGSCKASNVNPLSLCGEPATAGDYLVLYATGLGKATPNGDPNGATLRTGDLPPADGSVLYQSVVKPVVTIGGLPATVVFSGIAPGFPGLYQIDVQVPAGVTGDDVPVAVSVGGGPADTRTIAIR